MKISQRIEGSQEQFLNAVIRENVPVVVYLISGVQLRGNIRGFDTFTLLLAPPGQKGNPVYKSAVSSIVPMRPIRLYSSTNEADRDNQRESTDQRAN